MRLILSDLAKTPLLAGSANGAALLSLLVGKVHRQAAQAVVALDFSGVEVATGSFLRECVLGFRDYCRRSQPHLYPVLADLNDTVLEELRDLLLARREAVVCCRLSPEGRPLEPRVVGVLEEKQLLTLDAVLELGEADAGTLAERFAASDRIGVTGWNNRLAALAAAGILIETRHGRAKRYRPVLEGLTRGA